MKTSIAVTNARTAGGQFIVGMQAFRGNPCDGHTLTGQIEQVERLTGITVERAYVDRGYKVTSMAERRGSISPTPAASPHPRSDANCGDEMPSSRSSATPNPTACSNAAAV